MTSDNEEPLYTSLGKTDLRTILDNLPKLVILLDFDGRILYWNKRGEKVFGYQAEEVIGRSVWFFYPELKKDTFEEKIALLRKGEDLSFEIKSRHKDGTNIWLDVKKTMIKNSRGERLILAAASDISLQKKAELELSQSQARTAAILETAVEGIITINKEGIIQSVNKMVETMFGYHSEELIGENIGKLMPQPYQEEHGQYLEHYLETGERKVIGVGREVRGKRKDGSIFPIELAVSEVKVGGEIIFTGLIKDISNRRKLENEIIGIAEDERRRIGHELHDGLGQMLSGISLISRNLARKLKANGLPAADQVLEISKMIREADEQARDLARGLAHIELENEGLQIAMARLCGRMEDLTTTSCTFKYSEGIAIENKTVSLHLYRIAQEAINNAVKHGRATKIVVRLEANKKNLKLIVEDNGEGFSESKQQTTTKGMGIKTMNYRSHIMGGDLNITEIPEGWTRVTCSIPTANIHTINRI